MEEASYKEGKISDVVDHDIYNYTFSVTLGQIPRTQLSYLTLVARLLGPAEPARLAPPEDAPPPKLGKLSAEYSGAGSWFWGCCSCPVLCRSEGSTIWMEDDSFREDELVGMGVRSASRPRRRLA